MPEHIDPRNNLRCWAIERAQCALMGVTEDGEDALKVVAYAKIIEEYVIFPSSPERKG